MKNINVYEMVTNKIISELESGVIPWRKPWSNSDTGSPQGAYNRVSNSSYSFINQMILKHSGEYATFKQWSDLGGKIKKGEKSEFVVFWKVVDYEDVDSEGNKKTTQVPLLRFYNVFHISQVEGVKPKYVKKSTKKVDPVEACEEVIQRYVEKEHIDFHSEVQNRAFYQPDLDKLVVPAINQYKNSTDYYSTVFHELVHSTGHKSRLNRLDDIFYERCIYSKEELVAEIGSCFLLKELGVETEKSFRDSESYIKGWLGVLKNDVKFIISASSSASKAVDYIQGRYKNYQDPDQDQE